MKTIVKLVIGLAVGVVVLLVAAVVIVILSINGLAKKGIEEGGAYALGVPTTLDSASVGLFSGKFSMKGLEVANPEGFTDTNFFALGEGAVQIDPQSFGKDVIELPLLSLDTITANLEKKGGQANYKVILDHVKSLGGSGEGEGDKPAEPAGDEQKLIVRELIIRNVNVKLDLLGLPGGDATAPFQKIAVINIPIDEIKLNNVGKTGEGVAGSGVTMGELTGIIVQAVMAAAIQKGGDAIPAELLGDLQGSLSGLTDLSSLGFEALGDAPAQVQKLGEDLTKAAEDAGKALEDGATKVEEGLKGLIPGQKP